MLNLILNVDSYKHSHYAQLPADTQFMSSYLEARKSPGASEQITQFFGTQAFLRRYLESPIYKDDIDQADEILSVHGLPFNRAGWERILTVHDGFLPLHIQALPEGTVVPRGTPMVQVENTDPTMPWLTSFIETTLLRSIWYPSSVATVSFLSKAIIREGLLRTSDNVAEQLPFKLHDFGGRGVSSSESAGLGSMAHLLNFMGTDTLEGIMAARLYYDAEMPGFSIPASEHSTMTAWGPEFEWEAYSNMIDKFGNGLFSVVSDSYDLWNAIENIYGDELKEKILAMPGKLIVRPDSGDPVDTPLEVLEKLWSIFGGTVNSKGYKVLNPKVGVIQGDGMNAHMIGMLVAAVTAAGFSVDNIAFGMGGGLLQAHTRDDMRFAMKANAIKCAGENAWADVQKNPATDPSKASKAGRQAVYLNKALEMVSCRESELPEGAVNLLRTVYRDGNLIDQETFDEVRGRSDAELVRFCENVFRPETANKAA